MQIMITGRPQELAEFVAVLQKRKSIDTLAETVMTHIREKCEQGEHVPIYSPQSDEVTSNGRP